MSIPLLRVPPPDITTAINNLIHQINALAGYTDGTFADVAVSNSLTVSGASDLAAVAATDVTADSVTTTDLETTTLTAAGALTASSTLEVVGHSGFNGTSPIAKPTVTGSRGSNAALTSLLTALAAYGLVLDSSS